MHFLLCTLSRSIHARGTHLSTSTGSSSHDSFSPDVCSELSSLSLLLPELPLLQPVLLLLNSGKALVDVPFRMTSGTLPRDLAGAFCARCRWVGRRGVRGGCLPSSVIVPARRKLLAPMFGRLDHHQTTHPPTGMPRGRVHEARMDHHREFAKTIVSLARAGRARVRPFPFVFIFMHSCGNERRGIHQYLYAAFHLLHL